MAITNAQIIANEKLLRGISCEIHTFEKWKSMGFAVKKGEKSNIKFAIWKYSTKGKGKKNAQSEKADEDGEKIGGGYCFMKMSAFFTEKQVEPIKAGT